MTIICRHVSICNSVSKPHKRACTTTYITFNPIGESGWWTLITDPQAIVAATIVVILVLAVMKFCKPENSAIINRTNNRAHLI